MTKNDWLKLYSGDPADHGNVKWLKMTMPLICSCSRREAQNSFRCVCVMPLFLKQKLIFLRLIVVFHYKNHFAMKKKGGVIWNFVAVTVTVRPLLMFFTLFSNLCHKITTPKWHPIYWTVRSLGVHISTVFVNSHPVYMHNLTTGHGFTTLLFLFPFSSLFKSEKQITKTFPWCIIFMKF